jgi:hypothetical protein
MPNNGIRMGGFGDALRGFAGDVPAPKVQHYKHYEPGKRGDELFHLILSGIREVYDVDAIIAGGAVRDVAAGCSDTSKDVDIFLPMKWADFFKGMGELGWIGMPAPVPTKAYAGRGTFKSSARALGNVQGIQADIVFVEGDLKAMVGNFPIFAQRGVWTLGEGLVLSPEAKADIEAKQFTIDAKITDKERLVMLMNKVKEWQKRPAYKDWKLIEPDIKEWWEAKAEEEKKPKKERNKKKYNDPFEVAWDQIQAVERDHQNAMAQFQHQAAQAQQWVDAQAQEPAPVIAPAEGPLGDWARAADRARGWWHDDPIPVQAPEPFDWEAFRGRDEPND